MPSSTLRQVVGALVQPDGAGFANKTITWFRKTRGVTAQGTTTVLDEPFLVATDADGNVDTWVMAGFYLLLVKLRDADRYFRITVPDEVGPHTLAVLLEYTDVSDPTLTQIQSLVQQAQAWAESDTSPGDVGTKSAKSWSDTAKINADAAALYDGFRVDSLASITTNTALTYTAGQSGTVAAGNRGYASEDGKPVIVLSQTATTWDFISPNGVKLNLTGQVGKRSAYAAALLAGQLRDGEFGFLGSQLYEKSAAAIGALSCTNDLGVDGLIPAHGRATPWHFGADSIDATFDSTAEVQAAFDWARGGWDSTNLAWTRHVDLGGRRWRTTYPINVTGIRQPRFAFGNGEIYGDFTGIGGVIELYGTNSPHVFGILTIGAPEERAACPFYGYAHGRQDTDPLAVSSAPIAPSHAKHLETYGCFQRAALLNLGSEVSRTKGHLQNRAIQATSCVVASFGDQKHAVKRWGVPVTSVFTDLPSVADGAFSNILHDYSGVEMKASAFWNATITGVTNASTAVVSFTAVNSFQMNRIVEGDIIYLTGVAGMTQINATKFEIRSLVKTGLTGTFNLYFNGAPVNSSAYGTFTGSAYMWRASGDCFVGGSVRGVNIGGEAYLLTFGGDPIVIYAGGDANEIKFSGQTENSCKQIVRFITETGSYTPVVGMELDLMSASQVMERVIVTEGNGTVALADFRLAVKTHARSFKLVEGGPATVSFSRAHLSAPVDIVMTGADSFTGHVEKFGAGGETNKFIGGVETDRLNFSITSTALSNTGIRADAASGGQLYARGPSWTAERMLMTTGKATSAQLSSATSDINTQGKAQGTPVFVTDLNYYVVASNNTATGPWRNIATGAITHTPT